MGKFVVVMAALDTKGEEARLIRDYVASRGHTPVLVDIGVLDEPKLHPGSDPAVDRDAVADAGGVSLHRLRESREKATAMDVMTRGAAVVAARLRAEGHLDGIVAIGGSAGTAIGTSAMRALPVGVPKVMVSTVASGDTRAFVGTKDITMMYSVVDVAGINRLSAVILTNAAGAVVGMVEAEPPQLEDRPLIAASMFGNTTPCVDRARQTLESKGYEVLVFHATGSGGQTMESVIADGFVDGVLDVTTTEWADELVGGVMGAGPTRLDAAAKAGVPTVIAPGCLDMVNFWGIDTVPEKFRGRNLYQWNPNVTLMRTTPEENAQLGRIIAEKANSSTGPVAVMLPLRGVSQLDSEGNPFWSPEADRALYDAIKATLRPGVELIEVDANVNDPLFADAATAKLLELIGARA
jgi:uncharacterized protein (UPF0261 family)